MENFESINIPSEPKAPITSEPTLDEKQIEDNESLEELLEKKEELEKRIEEGEDVNFEYQLVIEKIVKQFENNYENSILDGLEEQRDENDVIKTEEFDKVDPWEDIGYHKGFDKKEFPHPTKSTKTPAQIELAKKIAIAKALKKRAERDSHIGYIDPLDPTL